MDYMIFYEAIIPICLARYDSALFRKIYLENSKKRIRFLEINEIDTLPSSIEEKLIFDMKYLEK
jgi:hypothetical protein